jgi:glycosyltransferase involved in cell wall biosynthesis
VSGDRPAADRPLRIAQVAPPLEAVPPIAYGGTERIVAELVNELHRRGHEVTTFASGDSRIPGDHVVTVPEALRPTGFAEDPADYFEETVRMVIERAPDFDVIHGHVDRWNLELARRTPVPVVSTFHGRLDLPWARAAFAGRPRGLVAISEDQARVHPEADWTVIHHGLTFGPPPIVEPGGQDLAFVGRITPEKGVMDAIEIARLTGRRLLVAAKVPTSATEVKYWRTIVKPALAGADVTILGELPEPERDRLVASSRAAIIPSAWPEPFGLVVIEALALGTPVLVRRSGAIPELVRDGIDGFIGDDAQQLAYFDADLDGLDRVEIRRSALERFSVGRMVDRYEAFYRRMLES